MPIPGNNLPLLDGNVYMHVQALTPILKKTYRCDDKPLDEEECEHVGQAISILRFERDGIRAKAQHYAYSVKCDKAGRYSVRDITTRQRNISFTEDAYNIGVALKVAYNPYEFTMLALDYLLLEPDMLYRQTDLIRGPSYGLTNMLSANNTGINKINPRRVTLAIRDTKIDMSHLNRYVNNTYLNVVHDCERICVHSVLSNDAGFMSITEAKMYGLLCTSKLIKAQETHMRLQTKGAAFAGPLQHNAIDGTTTIEGAGCECPQRMGAVGVISSCIGALFAFSIPVLCIAELVDAYRTKVTRRRYSETKSAFSVLLDGIEACGDFVFGSSDNVATATRGMRNISSIERGEKDGCAQKRARGDKHLVANMSVKHTHKVTNV